MGEASPARGIEVRARASRSVGSRRGLYARSAMFVAIGAGSLLGAMLVVSRSIVLDAENRLLDERIGLARIIGSFLESRIRADLRQVADAGAPLLTPLEPARAAEVRRHLGEEAREGLFAEGVFVLDRAGAPVAAVPGPPASLDRLAGRIDLRELLAAARTGGIAISDLVFDPRPLVVVVIPIRSAVGRPDGFIAALFEPAVSDLLTTIASSRTGDAVEVSIIDRQGIVLASTDRERLFHELDHERILNLAIGERREFRGRCHNCHDTPAHAAVPDDEMDVLAFAPLPSLDLGLTVLQPESKALAPALALRRRLFTAGAGLIALFVGFSVLAVRSVVRPIRRLTRAVRQAESTAGPVGASRFASDEIGELAMALDLWRSRTVESMAQAEAHREALHRESQAILQHLDALRAIADASTAHGDMDELTQRSLERALALAGTAAGAVRLRHRSGLLTRSRGLSDEERDRLLDRVARAEVDPDPADGADGEVRVSTIDLADPAGAAPGRIRAAIGGVLRAPLGLELVLVVADERSGESMAPLWLGSLLRQVSLCASHLLLRDVDRERREQQEEYLRRVLGAQEDERSRIARDLHDTVAQDLAALRLELERVASHSPGGPHRDELGRLEARASEMLDTVRRILLDLRLSVLDSMGLLPALRWLLERTEREHGVRGRLVVDGDDAIAPGYQRSVALFRILQEALLNVAHHAGAVNVFATIALRADAVELSVEDDGRGFDVASLGALRPEGRSHGLGILGMEERARLFGGTLEVTSSVGEGTTIRVRVPLPVEDRA